MLHGWQERLEAKTLFASKEVEEETRKVSPKKFVPAEDTEMAEEQQTPKVVAPTQDQINAIKVIIGIKFLIVSIIGDYM